jgi:hypothetical protein
MGIYSEFNGLYRIVKGGTDQVVSVDVSDLLVFNDVYNHIQARKLR